MSKCSCGREAYSNDICETCHETWELEIERKREEERQYYESLQYECQAYWDQQIVSCGYGCGKEYAPILLCCECQTEVKGVGEQCDGCGRTITSIIE
jgi:hypothetical protein